MRRAIGAALLVLGCREPTPPPAERAPSAGRPSVAAAETTALDVLFVGCREVRAGPVCAIDPEGATLRVWAEVDPGLQPVLTIDGEATEASPEPVEGGVRWVVDVPASGRRLEIEADLDGARGRYELALEPSPPPGDDDPVVARMKESEDAHNEGELETAIRALEVGFELARSGGRRREASTMALQHVYIDIALRYDLASARRWLDRDSALIGDDPEQQMMHAYYEGVVAEYAREPRAALEAYEDCARGARAVGQDTLEASALTGQMLQVGTLGAWERAQDLQQRVLELEPVLRHPLRSQALNMVAWMLLEARARGRPADDPVPLLRRGLERLEDYEDSSTTRLRITIPLGLAYAAVLDGDASEARRWLDETEDRVQHHEDRLWRQLLLARVAGLEGDPRRGQRRFEALLAEADRLREPELRWHALLGLGRAQEATGHTEAAVKSYREAERVLDHQLPRLAIGEGRASFVAERDRSARRLVDLLLRLDRPREALCAARLARSRALHTIARQLRSMADASAEQREALRRHRETRARLEKAFDESWSLPAAAARQQQRALELERQEDGRALDRLLAELYAGDASRRCEDLEDPVSGTLDLYTFRLDDGWVGFGLDDQGLYVHRVGRLPLADAGPQAWPALSVALLEPLGPALERARQLRVMPSGELLRVPFHALPIPGEPDESLLDRMPVVYGLDLGERAGSQPRPRTSVVVAPPSNLRHASAELESVSRLLEQAGHEVRRLEGDDATGAAVRRALPTADLVHYVGHARSDDVGGWSSALVLARDGTLQTHDVLALSRAPRTVVLNGCETGRTDPQALAGGMSMAHAFVLAGASLVVATDREVEDAAATALIRAFYEARASGQESVEALRTAQLARRSLDEGWLITRGWVP